MIYKIFFRINNLDIYSIPNICHLIKNLSGFFMIKIYYYIIISATDATKVDNKYYVK